MNRARALFRVPVVLLAFLPLLFVPPAAAYQPAPPPACTTLTAYVVAMDQVLNLNRFGSDMPGGMIYALARDVFPNDPPPADYSELNSCRFAQPLVPTSKRICNAGHVQLRPDPNAPTLALKRPRPLVLRANEGDCLEIHFANLLNPQPVSGASTAGLPQPATRVAGVHVQGLNWVQGPQDDASNVGANGSSLVAPGAAASSKLFAEHEGAYLLYNTADDWSPLPGGGDGGTLAEGLFGAVNVQPSGRRFDQDWQSEFYRSQVNEQDLCMASTDAVLADPLHCARRAPRSLPVVNYQALYPPGNPRAYLPILNMVCSKALTGKAIDQGVCGDGELVHGDLTAMITGRSAPDPRLPKLPPQPQAFPNKPADEQPPSLRPNYAYPDRFEPFREFTIIYHESFQVTQAFATQINSLGSLAAAQDNFGINYGMSGLSNEVLANRLGAGPASGPNAKQAPPGAGPLSECVDCKYEEFFLSSWAMGDPAMGVYPPANACIPASGQPQSKDCLSPRALYPDDPSNVYHGYVSDHVRFRILHAGPDLHHLHHQHAQQWLGTPNSPDGDYLDSQSIGPGSAFTLEMVYNGSGNVNQTVGDSIFHCHFYPHFASGMWSLWRVHDVFEPGTILGDDGFPANRTNPVTHRPEYTRALPDGAIQKGAPNIALVPLPTLPMAPMPAGVRLQGVCSNAPAKNCLSNGDCSAGGTCTEMGSRYCVVQGGLGKTPERCLSEFQSTDKGWDQVDKSAYPGYPFFIPGIGGSRPPHPPLDFAYACEKSGRICDPTIAKDKNPKAEGLQPAAKRAVQQHILSWAPRPDYQAPIFADQVCGPQEGECEPMDGGLPRAVTAQGPSADWRSLQTMDPAPASQFQNLDFSKEILQAQAIELPETGTQVEKIAMKVHAQRFHDTQLPDGRKTGVCSDNRAPCTATDKAECGNPAKATCTPGRINFILNGLGPQPGAPYADPCIKFDRNGGPPDNMLTRSYLAADLQLDAIFNREGWHFPQQRILSLWGDVKDYLDRKKPPEPLFMRVNSYDCMTYVLANLVPNVYEQDDFQVRTPTDVIGQHIHLVKFDVTSSDGAENGWNYEDGTYGPNEVTERIDAINKLGGIYLPPGEKRPGAPCTGSSGGSDQRCLEAKYIKFFGPGPGAQPNPGGGNKTTGAWLGSQATVQRWYDDPLFNNTGLCSTDLHQRCTLGQEQAGIFCPKDAKSFPGTCVVNAGLCSDLKDQPCTQEDRHLCGSKEANCEPSHDRTIRTVFTHDHFGPSTHQQGGLYAGVVAEPKGSIWRHNQTGEIMGGYDAAADENFPGRTATANGVAVKDGGPTSWEAVVETPQLGDSFREFLLEVQDSTLLYAPFQVGTNPIGKSNWQPDVCGNHDDEPCGFCSLTGRCSNDPTTTCRMQPFASQVPPPPATPPSDCAAGGTCLYGLNPSDARKPYLVACTPADLSACKQGNVESCNFIPGIPSPAWTPIVQAAAQATTLSGPIDFNKKGTHVEAITFQGSTNSFSYNYRDEPLYPRIDSAPSSTTSVPKPLPGTPGDLAFVYSSLKFCQAHPRQVCSQDADCGAGDTCPNRANPRGGRCSLNLNQLCDLQGGGNPCPSGMGNCENAGFCSDNYALCTASNESLCGSGTCETQRVSVPYPPLTAGIEPTDPFTPLLRGYAGDDVQLRVLIGAHINPHNFTLHGLNWLNQPSYVDSGWRNSQVMGISEHYNLLVKLDPVFDLQTGEGTYGAPLKPWMDFLYQPGAAAIEQAAGNWGLIRSYGTTRDDLWPLPQNNYSPGTPFKTVPVCKPGAKPRDYEVVALTAQRALGGPLVYNQTQGISDSNALLFFDTQNPGLKCTRPGDWSSCTYSGTPEPLVLRAAAGECIHVKLYNGLPYGVCSNDSTVACTQENFVQACPPVLCKNGWCTNASTTKCTLPSSCPQLSCNYSSRTGVSSAQLQTVQTTPTNVVTQLKAYTSNTSMQVGLRPQLVTTDPRFSDGTNVGFNPPQTAPPGGSVTYTWYAGHIEPEYVNPDYTTETKYIPIEFGAANLLPPDPLNQALHGLFGGLIIEPERADWGHDAGVQAYVRYHDDYTGEDHTFHEFVVFTPDDTNLASVTPSGTAFDLVNYSTEVLNNGNNPPPRCCESGTTPPPPTTSSPPISVACVLNTIPPLVCNSAFTAGNPPTICGSCNPRFDKPATPMFVAHVGEEVRFRLLHPGGTNTNEVFEVAGHTYLQTPYETPPVPEVGCEAPTTHTNLFASSRMGENNLCGSIEFLPKEKTYRKTGKWGVSLSEWKASRPMHGPSNHYDVLIHEAGGPYHRCGDYLYRSYPADHFALGIWGLFRVDGCSSGGGATGGGATSGSATGGSATGGSATGGGATQDK